MSPENKTQEVTLCITHIELLNMTYVEKKSSVRFEFQFALLNASTQNSNVFINAKGEIKSFKLLTP